MPSFQLESLDHIAFSVRDLRKAREFYQEVLGLERRHQEAWGDEPTMLAAGSTMVALFQTTDPQAPPPVRAPIGFRHFAFRVSRADFDRARAELDGRGIAVEFEDHGIAHSIYFADPDGHALEITTYEV